MEGEVISTGFFIIVWTTIVEPESMKTVGGYQDLSRSRFLLLLYNHV